MRALSEHFFINGKPMLVPDEEITPSYEDLDDGDSGRDESGVMHRIVVRYKVCSWPFSYAFLTEEEKQYMESLFPDEPDFIFSHPDRLDASKSVQKRCYRSKYSITWKNAKTGQWMNYAFNIIEC